MNQLRSIPRKRRKERGQTILLVAISLVSLLAMAALAIDVVTLYAARSEAQRAADAAALVGAKAFVDSGVTTDPANTTLQTLAQDMATAGINSVLQQNTIAGVAPALAAAPTFNFTNPGNPQISVTLQRTNLPIFFARIWGNRPMTISATATAEAYNPSGSQTNTGNYVPIAPKCVKPLLVVNADNTRAGAPFVTPATGAAATGVVGESLTLTQACTSGGPATCTKSLVPVASTFYPAVVTPNSANLCPSCQGAADYEQSIECCDFNLYSCGGTVANAQVDMVIRHGQLRSDTSNGLQCLMNAAGQGLGQGQDILDVPPGGTDPMQITASSGPQSGNLVTTSNSIATLPIINADPVNTIPLSGQVTIIGFLQVFVDSEQVVGNQSTLNAHVLNISGCGNSPGATPVVASGATTPIPVRLVHP
jgi:Flp pilus assembly protein TadG